MERLIELRREQAKWPVICRVLIHLRTAGPIDLIQSGWSLIYRGALPAYPLTIFLSTSHPFVSTEDDNQGTKRWRDELFPTILFLLIHLKHNELLSKSLNRVLYV